MLPPLNDNDKTKKKKRSEKRAYKKRTSKSNAQQSTKHDSALKRIGKFTIRQMSKAGQMFEQQLVSESQSAGIIYNSIRSLTDDIKDLRGAVKDKDSENRQGSNSEIDNKVLVSSNGLLKNMAKVFTSYSKVSLVKFDKIIDNLGVLDSIWTELRTLTKITSKVWDVTNKTLYDTRSRAKKFVEKERESRETAFEEKISKFDNKSYSDLRKDFDNDNVKADGTKEKKSMFTDMKDRFKDGIFGHMTQGLFQGIGQGATLGSGAAAGGLSKLLGKVTKTPLKALKAAVPLTIAAGGVLGGVAGGMEQAKETDFGKMGDRISNAHDKAGLAGVVTAIFTDEQLDKLLKAILGGVVDGVQDALKTLTKFIIGKETYDKIASGIESAESAASSGIARGLYDSDDDMKKIAAKRKEMGLAPLDPSKGLGFSKLSEDAKQLEIQKYEKDMKKHFIKTVDKSNELELKKGSGYYSQNKQPVVVNSPTNNVSNSSSSTTIISPSYGLIDQYVKSNSGE